MENETHIIQLLKKKQYEMAVTAIVNSYHELLYWHVRKLVKHHDHANDTLQNTYLRIFKGISKFRFKSSVKTWCFRIAYNEGMRFLQQNQKHNHSDSNSETTSYFTHLVADPYFDCDSVSHALHESLAKLSEKQQQIFQMKYYDELTFEEISEITSWNINTIKTAFYTAKKTITIFVNANV